MAEQREGGWSSFGPITTETKTVFAIATGDGVVGRVKYTPKSVAHQVVAGMNYDYECSATPANGDEPIEWKARVFIFAPLNGLPYVKRITPA